MTEAEWLAFDDTDAVLTAVSDRFSDRRWRLLGCACARLSWHLLTDPRSRAAIATSERFADGDATAEELTAAKHEAFNAAEATQSTGNDELYQAAAQLLWAISLDRPRNVRCVMMAARLSTEQTATLVKDVVQNPFRPVALDPAWRTEAVVGLAAGIYADRAFDRLPVLADALEDAGCADADVLTHCRGPGPHVRGCWVVDLLLGKS